MRTWFIAVVVFGWLLPASTAWAAPPVSVTHSMTKYIVGADFVEIEYQLSVKNMGAEQISSGTLSLDTVSSFGNEQAVLDIGGLDPQAETQIALRMMVPQSSAQFVFPDMILFFVCDVMTADGGHLLFPLSTMPGGAI